MGRLLRIRPYRHATLVLNTTAVLQPQLIFDVKRWSTSRAACDTKAAFTRGQHVARQHVVSDEQLVSGYIYVDGHVLPDTSCSFWIHVDCFTLCLFSIILFSLWLLSINDMYLGDIITIHLCHGRLVSLCIQQQTGNKLATILLPTQETC